LGRKQYRYVAIPLDNSFPKYILDNREKYKDLIFTITYGYRLKKLFGKIIILFVELIPVAKWRRKLKRKIVR